LVQEVFGKIYEKYLKINKYLSDAEFVKSNLDVMQKKYGSPFYDYRIIKTLSLKGKYSIQDISLHNFGSAKKGWHTKIQAINSYINGSKYIPAEKTLVGLQIVQKYDNREKYRRRFELTPYGFVLSMILFTSSMWHSKHFFSGKSNSTKIFFFGKQGIKNSKRFLEQSCENNQKNLPVLTDIIYSIKDDEDALGGLSHFWGEHRSKFDMELENAVDFYQIFRNDEEKIVAAYYYYLMESNFVPKNTCMKLKKKCKPETLKFLKTIEKYVKLSTEWLSCSLKLSQMDRLQKSPPKGLFEKFTKLSDDLVRLRLS